jgi:hypothetical protein
MIFRVARGFAIQLAKVSDVIEGDGGLPDMLIIGIDRLDAGQVENRPKQHGGVAVGQDKAVAIGPDRIVRIIAQGAVPDGIDERGQGHRGAGVAGLGCLHRIDGKRADCIDGELRQFIIRHNGSFLWLSPRFRPGCPMRQSAGINRDFACPAPVLLCCCNTGKRK